MSVALTSIDQRSGIQRLSLRRNFAWTLGGHVIYSACQWGILVALARIGGPETVGQFALGLAVTTPVFMFTSMQLRALQATDAKHEFSFSDYFSLRFISSLLALPIIAGLLLLSHYRLQSAVIISLVAFAKAIESISDVIYGLLQQTERMDRIAISMILRGVLSLAALGLTTYVTGSLIYGTLALALSWLATLFLFDVRLTTTGSSITRLIQVRTIDWASLRRLCKPALPMSLVMMLLSVNANLPRYFVEHYYGERTLGIFAALGYVLQAGTIVITALGTAAIPRLAAFYAQGRAHEFRRLLLRLVALAVALGVFSIGLTFFFGHRILLIVYGAEYAKHMNLFILLVSGSAVAFVGSFLGNALNAKRRFMLHVPIQIGLLIAGLVCCYAFMRNAGLTGVGYAVLATSIVSAVAYGVALFIPNREQISA